MRRLVVGLAFAGAVACASPPPVVYYPQTPSGPVVSTPSPERAGPRAAQGPFQPDFYLYACTESFSNRPETDRSGRILSYDALIVVNNVILATAPTNGTCMTSGFGPRFGRMHNGIDLHARPAVPIYSSAPGRILEVSTHRDYGLQVLIDHGNGVFTRYAHFAYFTEGLKPGQQIGFGQPLGLMGETGNATGLHVHYEVLTGNYNTPQKSWGLQAHNPLDFPRWSGLDGLS